MPSKCQLGLTLEGPDRVEIHFAMASQAQVQARSQDQDQRVDAPPSVLPIVALLRTL